MKYTVTLYEENYNFDTHKYELNNGKSFKFGDYDSVQNLIGYMSEGNPNVIVRIKKEEDDE